MQIQFKKLNQSHRLALASLVGRRITISKIKGSMSFSTKIELWVLVKKVSKVQTSYSKNVFWFVSVDGGGFQRDLKFPNLSREN